MTATTATIQQQQLDELASTPDGPGRVALLGRLLVEYTAPAMLQRLGAALGERWPAAALRALRAIAPDRRPSVLAAVAPWLDAALAREALDMVALFDAPLDIERVIRALAPRLVDAPVVALLRVLRHVEDPPAQVALLCAVARHAEGAARAGLLAAAARVAQRTASEPERLTAAVEVAVLGGAEAALEAWKMVAQTHRRDLRLRLLATLAPAIAPELLPDLLAGLAAPAHDIEAILQRALGSLHGEVLLDALAQLGPLVGPGGHLRDRLLVEALARMRGLDLLVVVQAAIQRFDNLYPPTRDELLGRALAELDDAELAAAAPRLRDLDAASRGTALGHALARLRGAPLVAAIERFRRCVPTVAVPDAALVRAASTCPRAALARVEALVDAAEASAAPIVVALRRGGAVAPELLRRGLARLGDVPRTYTTALMTALTSGRTLVDLIDIGAPADRQRAAAAVLDNLVALRCGAGERAAALAVLLPRLPADRARDALFAGVRWGQRADAVLDAMFPGRAADEVAEILATLGTSGARVVVDAVDRRIAILEPDAAFALAHRLLRADSRVGAVQRRLASLGPRLGAAQIDALHRDPSHHPARLATLMKALTRAPSRADHVPQNVARTRSSRRGGSRQAANSG